MGMKTRIQVPSGRHSAKHLLIHQKQVWSRLNCCLVGGALFVLGLRGIAQPSNDDFADRISFTGMTNQVQGSFDGATLEAGEPVTGGDRSIWWSWTAPKTGSASFYADAG